MEQVKGGDLSDDFSFFISIHLCWRFSLFIAQHEMMVNWKWSQKKQASFEEGRRYFNLI